MNKKSVQEKGNYIKVNPPIRGEESQERLLKALQSGLVDTIGTDHAPHTKEEKEKPYEEAPSGLPGVETSLPVMLNALHEGKIDLKKVVEVMAENPAKIFNIEKRGKIEEGYYADLAVVDLHLTRVVNKRTIYSKCGWTPLDNLTLTGWPITTIIGGSVVFHNDKPVGEPGGKDIFVP